MSQGFERITIMGNIGQLPGEIKYTKEDREMTGVSFFVAVNSRRNAENNHTNWYKVSHWGTSVKFVTENIKKGDTVLVEGHIKIKEWQTMGTNEHGKETIIVNKKFEIIATKILKINRNNNTANDDSAAPYSAVDANDASAAPYSATGTNDASATPYSAASTNNNTDNNIPF